MTDDGRPDPDTLLAQIHADAARAHRGRLRIYFGSSAGVGKTYAMLVAARKLREAGMDVVAGIVETHGRDETAALLEGLPALPARQVPHRDRVFAEFDLDAALQRHPGLILVDELAHSNVAGSRHAKRWQDVEELLAAGIDVYSTLNVQHLESLNDVVGGITGIVVHETLPDTFFDRADEVVLVDTPADELIERLATGKVYLPAQAGHAARNFFRKGNLMALRELALRRTADRVEEDVQAYRIERRVGQVWKTEDALLCCIGPREGAEHVVRGTARLARQLAVNWHAVYVETPALQRLAGPARERILQTVRLAEELGAHAAVVVGHGVAQALVDYARRNNLSKVILGRSDGAAWPWQTSLARTLGRLAPDVDRIELGRPARKPPARAPSEPVYGDISGDGPWRYGSVFLGCAATTLLSAVLMPYFELANIVMVFLLGVVGIALWQGRGPAVLAAFLNVAAFDFFFVPPRLSFAVSDVQYLLTFAVMLAVGLLTGQLTAGLRFQARVATHREARSRALFEAARELSSTLTTEQAIDAAVTVVAREFRADVVIYTLDHRERIIVPAGEQPGLDLGTAQWTYDHLHPAGLGTDTLAGSRWLYLPLKATMRARGVLALRPREPRLLLVPEQRSQLETFAALTAQALERLHYIEVARGATVQMESERLRNSLLAALSHDLRTPISALVAATEMLARSRPELSAPQQELAASIRERALRMADMVTKLLDMARIQSGEIRLHREWQSMEECIGSAVHAAGVLLAARPLRITIEPGVPLVECDGVLIERVLANLLENAAKYTPPDSPLEILVHQAERELQVRVRDHGPGIPPALKEAIFEKFTRGHVESATPGVGLGLAICRAILAAHGGRIWVEPTHPSGATFVFSLPLGDPPSLEGADELLPLAAREQR